MNSDNQCLRRQEKEQELIETREKMRVFKNEVDELAEGDEITAGTELILGPKPPTPWPASEDRSGG